ncbi:uncharacterized protein involved in chromosome partitioning [Burkholderiales bacterium JOSHI_001]|nr:uncharacterized protein involved in chromosome partitioning [Burkholderiales bacterium JOSHI_001]
MNKLLFRAAFGVGLLAIAWVSAGYLRSNPLALVMTLLIAAFYLMGALELWRFDETTAGLGRALVALGTRPEPVNSLDEALAAVPDTLRPVVRQRVEGERAALPGPAMAPYLAGLLVLLGMLGTFLGMVVTLNGTGVALERATDLATMRESLAAPVKGLGLAFGTSVAGVAASAMLGLMSALCRRARVHAAQQLDQLIASTLHPFTRTHQRQAALALQQQQLQLQRDQAQHLPALVDQLKGLMAQLEQQQRQAGDSLLERQAQFHTQADAAYKALAASVDQTLQHSLSESARVAAASWLPAVESTMAGIARETTALQGGVAASVQQQLEGLSSRFEATSHTVAGTWARALADHQRASEALAQRLGAVLDGFGSHFQQRSADLVDALAKQHAQLNQNLADTQRQAQAQQQAEGAARDEQRQAAWAASLAAVSTALQEAWQEAGTHTLAQQARICQTLEQTAERISAQAEAHARGTLSEVARLVDTAAEAPRAAADVVAQLRDKLSDSMVRDNAMLEERARVMATLNTLLDAVQHTSTEQKMAIDSLVASTAAWLESTGARFNDKVDAQSASLQALSTQLGSQLGSSAVEVASLGEAFGAAVAQFSASSGQLMGQLQRVEEALGKSLVRSDEQLAYYVAQAREVIDLSLMSQKQIVEDLQRVAGRRSAEASEA